MSYGGRQARWYNMEQQFGPRAMHGRHPGYLGPSINLFRLL